MPRDFISSMNNLKESISFNQDNGSYPNLLVYGDFNFKDLEWFPGTLPAAHNNNSQLGSQINALLSLMRDHLLAQVVTKNTRIGSILDLVLVNNHKIINDIHHEVNSSLSYHYTLITNLSIYMGKIVKKKQIKNYYTTDLYH